MKCHHELPFNTIMNTCSDKNIDFGSKIFDRDLKIQEDGPENTVLWQHYKTDSTICQSVKEANKEVIVAKMVIW